MQSEIHLVQATVVFDKQYCGGQCDHASANAEFCTLYKEACELDDRTYKTKRCRSCVNGETVSPSVLRLQEDLKQAKLSANDKRVSLAQEIAATLRKRGYRATHDYMGSDLINDVAIALSEAEARGPGDVEHPYKND